MMHDSEVSLRTTGEDKLADEWALVLVAQGLRPSVTRGPDGIVLSVPEHEIERARAVLLAYENENPEKPVTSAERVSSANPLMVGAAAGILILVFFVITAILNPTMSWSARGSADAQRILSGELWRAVTALTLHADVGHALSNAVALGLLLGALSTLLGTGLAIALILLAGAGGNLANAFLRASPHVSLGASTAIFGAVGALGCLSALMRRKNASPGRRAWLPMAAALALLGMLGTAGERVDVWAHLFGLLAGTVLGIVITIVAPRPPGVAIQWACGSAAVAALICCWILAFG